MIDFGPLFYIMSYFPPSCFCCIFVLHVHAIHMTRRFRVAVDPFLRDVCPCEASVFFGSRCLGLAVPTTAWGASHGCDGHRRDKRAACVVVVPSSVISEEASFEEASSTPQAASLRLDLVNWDAVAPDVLRLVGFPPAPVKAPAFQMWPKN